MTSSLTKPVWIALLILGLAGQLAWAVENQFYNTFMYNHITPDPRPISWMVAITALVSTGTAILVGAVSAPLIREEPVNGKPEGTYWGQIANTFRLESLRANHDLFLVLLAVTLFMLAQQVFFPYLLIYLQHYIQLDTLEYSILVGVAILVGGILMAYPIGLPVDRWGRRQVAPLAIAGERLRTGQCVGTGNGTAFAARWPFDIRVN